MSPAPNLDSDLPTTSSKTDTHHVYISSPTNFRLSRKTCKVRFPARKVRKNTIPENNKSDASNQSNGGFMFGGSDACNNRTGSFVFRAERSSSGVGNAVESNRTKLESESKREKFVFGSSTENVSFDFRANSNNCSTTVQSNSTTDSHDAGKAGLSNGNAGFIFSAGNNSSTTQSSSTNRNSLGVSDADVFPKSTGFMTSSGVPCASSTSESNGDNVFVFNAKPSSSSVKSCPTNLKGVTDASPTAKDPSSQAGRTGNNGALGQSRKANDFAFVFTAKNGVLASGLNETNVGAAVHSQMNAGKDSLLGSDCTQGTNIGGTTAFVSKGESSSDFGFRGNAKENFSSPADWKNHLKGSTTRFSDTLPSEPVRTDFKFVSGSGSASGSAFYKVPLSKLVDEMKGLKIDDYGGTGGYHNSKNVGASFHFRTCGVNTTQNGGPASSFSTRSVGNTSKNQHKDPHSHSTVGGSQAQKDDIMAGSSVVGEIKASKPCAMNDTASTFRVGVSNGVNLPCSSKGEIREQREFPTIEVDNKENFSFTTAPSDLKSPSELNKASSNKSKPLAEVLEFVLNVETSNEKKLKKTGRKLRFKTRAKNMTQQKNMPPNSKSFESPGHSSPMNFSPYQEKTDIAPDSASAPVTVESKEEDFSAGTDRSDSTSDGLSVAQDSVKSMDSCGINFKSDSSFPGIDPSSKTRRNFRKKYKLKVGDALNGKTTINTSCNVKPQVQSGVIKNTDNQFDSGVNYQDPTNGWRIRGNQAYKAGDLSLAEDLYTKGICLAVDRCDASGTFEPLLLCYGNRAAARMALGRMREALDDCRSAAALDPSFTKCQLRAAHCHLVLGDYKAAMHLYDSFLESANCVCLDRRLAIDAADSLRKAQKVGEYMCRATELLKQKTSDAANSSLSLITQALSISCYSEKLIEMKAEALFLLRKYKEVIELCEQTLQTAEKNFTGDEHLDSLNSIEWKSSPRLWRWHLMAKSNFHWGRLEVALDLLEKREQLLKNINSHGGSMHEESPASLAVTVRDLLHRKNAGNEAFKQGKHMDAVEHYTGAISIGFESRPFVAVCFCNRAAALQALGQIVDAIADCNIAIALDENYFKAVSRRATLYEMIRVYRYASIDIEKLVSLLEKKSQEKAQQSGRQGESTGDKDLKQARRRLFLVEDKTRKELPLDLYLILGIKASDTESDIKKAYRKAALKHHPDKAGQLLARNEHGDDGRLWKEIAKKVHDDADKLFKMIGEAYGTLSDPDKRSNYNYEEEIRNNFTRESTTTRNTNSGGRSPNFHGYPRRQSNFYSHFYERRDTRNW